MIKLYIDWPLDPWECIVVAIWVVVGLCSMRVIYTTIKESSR